MIFLFLSIWKLNYNLEYNTMLNIEVCYKIAHHCLFKEAPQGVNEIVVKRHLVTITISFLAFEESTGSLDQGSKRYFLLVIGVMSLVFLFPSR